MIDEARWEINDTTPNAAWSMKHLGQDWTTGGLVFTTELGGPVDPRNVLRTIEIAAEKAGLKDVGVRMLRHRAAVMWLEAGAHIKAVADLLGHSSIAITGAAVRHFQADLQILTTRRCGGFNKDEALAGKRMLNPFSDASHIDPPLTSKFGR